MKETGKERMSKTVLYGDPNYHTEGDVPELCDVENAVMAVQATVAAIVTLDQGG
jgi:hypothetical protein